jgi:hypothetical protein
VVDDVSVDSESRIFRQYTLSGRRRVRRQRDACGDFVNFKICRLPWNDSLYFLFQEQDSPNSLFSFAIDISEDEGEEASSSRAVGITSVEIRAKPRRRAR